MGKFDYSKQEQDINRVLKYNQDMSKKLQNDEQLASARNAADANIEESLELLKKLGYQQNVDNMTKDIEEKTKNIRLEHRPVIEDWNDLLEEASKYTPEQVELEDLLTPAEIAKVEREREAINREFSSRTSIFNKKDLTFLAIATGLQVAKSLIFPYVAEKFDYGKSFDSEDRLAHNDSSIEKAHKEANDKFRDEHLKEHKTGYWINILYQTPPYDITKGSKDLGINMGGAYHRLHTLGHDPILGWLFGTANILTDVITLNDFQSFRVARNPMVITDEPVNLLQLFKESYYVVKDDYLNLPAAVFAQAQHLKSDVNTKLGLPVPLLATFNEKFASQLYKEHYDALCFSRDVKIVGASYIVSLFFDLVIGLVHGLFREEDEDKRLYEVRTRKILLISNCIASTSTIINAGITHNPKNLDIGSLLSTVGHLFLDIRFMLKIKEEFIAQEIDKHFQKELEDLDSLYAEL